MATGEVRNFQKIYHVILIYIYIYFLCQSLIMTKLVIISKDTFGIENMKITFSRNLM